MILSFLHHCILSDRIFTRVSRLKANLTIVGIATACNTMSKVAKTNHPDQSNHQCDSTLWLSTRDNVPHQRKDFNAV